MPFPSLIMGLIAKTRFKIPSGLKVVQRDCPIGDQIVNKSIAHIKGSKLVYIRYHRIELRTRGVILRRRLIDLLLLQSPQHNHPLLHQHEDQTDLIAFLIEWIRCLPCWTPMCNTQWPSLRTSRDRSLHCLLKLRICPWHGDQIQSLTSFSLFGHSGQKAGENFEGELRKSLHSVRGSIGLVLETLVFGSQAVYF